MTRCPLNRRLADTLCYFGDGIAPNKAGAFFSEPFERVLSASRRGSLPSNWAKDFVMTTQLRSAQFRGVGRTSGAMDGQPSGVRGLSRLVQVALAIYLLPALMIVLIVGVCGMLVLAVARVLMTIVRGPASWPRTPVGPTTSLSSDPRFNDPRS